MSFPFRLKLIDSKEKKESPNLHSLLLIKITHSISAHLLEELGFKFPNFGVLRRHCEEII